MRLFVVVSLLALLSFVVRPANAQSVCNRYVESGLGIDMEGTPADACAALAAYFTTHGRGPATVQSCDQTSGGVTAVLNVSNPTDTFPYNMSAVGGCAAEPPASAASSAPLDPANVAHLLQAALVVFFVGFALAGYGNGEKRA